MTRFSFITNDKDSHLEIVSTDWRPRIEIIFVKEKGKERNTKIINLEDFISIKGEKALGNKLTSNKIKQINLLKPLAYKKIIIENTEENDINNLKIPFQDISININISGGVAHSLNSTNFEEMVNLADERLYKSKENGRDQITFD